MKISKYKILLLLFIWFCFNISTIFGQKSTSFSKDTADINRLLEQIPKLKDNTEAVFKVANQILKIATPIKYDLGIGLANTRMVAYYRGRGDYAMAFEKSQKAMDAFEKIGEHEKKLDTKVSMSTLYKDIGAEKGTTLYLEKGIKIAKEVQIEAESRNLIGTAANSLSNQAIMLRDLSNIQNKPELKDTAFVYLKKAISLLENTEDKKRLLQKLYNNISQSYIEHFKDYPKALEVLNKSMALNIKANRPFDLSYNYANMSNLYLYQKDYKKAKEYAFKLLKIARELALPHRKMNAYEHLSDINKSMGLYDSALYYTEKRVLLNDSLTNLTKTAQVADMETKYETAKKELKINELNKESELKTKQTIWATIIGLLLLAGLGITAWYYKKLEKQKQLIDEQALKLQSMMKEIHHRVKNNLQIISSLLNIQSENITDESVLSSIQEGQSRVQAMSLIHQNLYQSDELTTVDIQNYLQQLLEYLSNMFVGDDKNIKINLKAENINFDIDTAIPLGLIVNELVSNAYKYAFDKHGKGTIDIEINAINKVDFELKIKDDGKGFPEGFNPEKGNSLGLKLVKILSRQLRGKFTTKSDNGALFIVNFKDLKMYNQMN